MTVHQLQEPAERLVPNMITNIERIKTYLNELSPDVVHSHSAVGTLAGMKAGYRTVHTIHGVIHQEARLAKTIAQKLNMWLAATLAKKAVAGANHVVAISRYAEAEYAKWIKGKVHHISNPVEDRFFDIESREIATKMLYAGVISDRKNVLGLVKAFHHVNKQNPEAELYICGKIVQQDHYASVQEYIKAHNLESVVYLLGFISQDELLQHFAEAAVICLFSYEETAPVLIGQAMAVGKPVVASRAGGTPDMVIDGETGFTVDMDDYEAFAQQALVLLSDEELRRSMGARARQVAEQRFRRSAVAEQTVAIYREMLQTRCE